MSEEQGAPGDTLGLRSPGPSHVVAIGASAGGLEALQQVFATMPVSTGMAFVVAQHLSPDFKSLMPELLARHTTMPVLSADHDQVLAADTVYVLAAGFSVLVEGDALRVQPRPAHGMANLPINLLFESVASLGPRAVAIVLSGTGQDGMLGAQQVHAQGGLVLAQRPVSARFDSMPRAAIDSGCVDIVAMPGEMGRALSLWLEDPVKGRHFVGEGHVEGPLEGPYDPILSQIRAVYDIDFSHYKPGTILRRIERRLSTGAQALTPETLARRLRDNRDELDTLFSDLLIGVTRFFRDSAAFVALREQAIEPLVSGLGALDELRIWSCGCSTGEEPYSLAMLALDAFERRGLSPRVRVLATDVHGTSVQRASTGLYSLEALQDVPEAMRRKYFVEQPTGLWKAGELLRRSVVFSVHNALRDAAFPRIDLVSCRNLLIYLQPHAQSHVLAAFHFSLRPGGMMFLGESETPGELGDAFEALDSSAHLFRKLPGLQLPTQLRASLGTTVPPLRTVAGSALDARGSARLHEALTRRYLPPGLLVNQHDEVVHVFGDAGRYLQAAAGRFGGSVNTLLSGALRTTVMMCLRQAAQRREPVVASVMSDEGGDEPRRLRVEVDPIFEKTLPHGYFMVRLLAELPAQTAQALVLPQEPDLLAHAALADLEAELQQTREALQRSVEDLESANEELQAGNEELMAANEELQSTNEELHAVNEELYTVNAEYELKIKELHETSADLNNLIRATELPIVFLDKAMQIRLFTPGATELFPLKSEDIGRSLRDFQPRELDPQLFDDLDAVLQGERRDDRQLTMADGRVLRRRATPYGDGGNVAGGVVLTYVDVTQQIRLQDAVARADMQGKLRAIVESVPHLMWTCDANGVCDFLNPQWVTYTGIDEASQLGEAWLEQVHADDRAGLMAAWKHAVDTGTMFRVRFRIRRHDGVYRWFDTQAVAQRDAQGHIVKWFGSNTDVHDALELQRRLDEQQAFIRLVADNINGMVGYWTRDERNRFANREYRTWFGRTPEQMQGITLPELLGPDLYAKNQPYIDAALRGERQRFERTLVRADGKVGHTLAEYIPHVVDGQVQGFFVTVTDVTPVQEARLVMNEVFHSNPTAQLVVGGDGRILQCNAAAVTLLGYPAETLRSGLTVEHLIPAELRERHRGLRQGYMAHAVRRPMGRTTGLRLLQGTGEEIDVDIMLAPVTWEGQHSVVLSIRPMSVVDDPDHRMGDVAAQARGTFLAQMSHEIRTPLNAILGMSQLLEIESPSPAQLDRLRRIEEASKHLLAIVDDILDLSKIEAGKLPIRSEVFDLLGLLDRSIDLVSDRAHLKQLRLETHLDPTLPQLLRGDARRIEQILVNLLTNAVKFTPAGSVSVSIGGAKAVAARMLLRFEVTDTGIGISREQMTHLFTPFRQVNEGSTRRYGGTGLGLSISRQLARAMNGDCGARSVPGRGSSFWFTVQVEPVETLIPTTPASPHDGLREQLRQRCIGKRALVVEDDPVNMLVTVALLKNLCGIEVLEAGDGPTALRQAREQRVDLVLMDVQMPDMDGKETTRRLRRVRGMKKVPIVAVTANVLPEEINDCLAAGMDAHLGKPLMLDDLCSLLARLFPAADDAPRGPARPRRRRTP